MVEISYTRAYYSDASQEEIESVIRHTDSVAEIHNTVQIGREMELIL